MDNARWKYLSKNINRDKKAGKVDLCGPRTRVEDSNLDSQLIEAPITFDGLIQECKDWLHSGGIDGAPISEAKIIFLERLEADRVRLTDVVGNLDHKLVKAAVKSKEELLLQKKSSEKKYGELEAFLQEQLTFFKQSETDMLASYENSLNNIKKILSEKESLTNALKKSDAAREQLKHAHSHQTSKLLLDFEHQKLSLQKKSQSEASTTANFLSEQFASEKKLAEADHQKTLLKVRTELLNTGSDELKSVFARYEANKISSRKIFEQEIQEKNYQINTQTQQINSLKSKIQSSDFEVQNLIQKNVDLDLAFQVVEAKNLG